VGSKLGKKNKRGWEKKIRGCLVKKYPSKKQAGGQNLFSESAVTVAPNSPPAK